MWQLRPTKLHHFCTCWTPIRQDCSPTAAAAALGCLLRERRCVSHSASRLGAEGTMRVGVTRSFVASWLLCRPAGAAGKNRMQLFGGALSRYEGRVAFCHCSTVLLSPVSAASSGASELLWPGHVSLCQPELSDPAPGRSGGLPRETQIQRVLGSAWGGLAALRSLCLHASTSLFAPENHA